MTSFRRLLALLGVLLVISCGGARGAPKTGSPELVVGSAKGSGDAGMVAVAAPREPGEEDARIPIFADDAVRGDRNAYVTLVVFTDFQCPFCRRLVPTLERVREEMGADVRLVLKNNPLPFHQHAKLAAEVGQGVRETRGNDAFWRFHDIAFERQSAINPDSIRAWAVAAGADSREIEAGLEAGRWAQKVERDMEIAKALGATGTPATFVNGVLLSGAQPFEKFKETVSAELGKAKALEERGIARATLYRVLAAENFKAPAARGKDDDDDDKEDTKTVWKVLVGTAPVRGSATAPVTIVEFSDFQCPYCKRAESTLEQVRKTYGDKVRLVWKDEPLPFHPRAEPAAQLARAARAQKGDAGFWDVHDKLFASQPKLDDADLEAVARAAGLDVGKAMAQVRAHAFKRAIEEDEGQSDDVQASGTPHFFINGRRLVGAQPFEKFKTIIDEEIAKAAALVRSGTAPAAVYGEIMKAAKGPPEPERKSVAPSQTAPYRGPANAPVVIQEFADFQCPFCARVNATLDELAKAYPTKVKIVWRDRPLPMHPNAGIAAEAAREAFAQKGNDGFWKMHAKLFANQQHLERSELDDYARAIGLDVGRFQRALDDHRHRAAVEADDKAGSDAGISGTPSFIIGPFYLSGAQPLAKFKKLVERALTNPGPAGPTTGAAGPVKTTAGGLVIQDLSTGTGREAKAGDKLVVHYTGSLTDGTVFDTSRKRGEPFTFELGKGVVIKGWDQGLLGMKVSGKRKLTIPPDLAYGERGMPPVIPPKSTLVFEVELVSIK